MKRFFSQLMKSPLFQKLTEDELKSLLNCMGPVIKEYRRNEIVYLMNDEVRYIGMVISGCVHMVKENRNGDKTLVSIIRCGELLGESFALGDDQLSYLSFVVMENTTILFLPFQKVMYSCKLPCVYHHKLIENMVTMIANKNLRLMQKIDISSQKTLREKIMTYLRLKEKEQGSSCIELDVNRTVMAEYLGVNRSALIRELGLMKEEGLIDYNKNKFWLNVDE